MRRGEMPREEFSKIRVRPTATRKRLPPPPPASRDPERPHLHPLRLVNALLIAADVEGVLHVEQLIHIPGAARGCTRCRGRHVAVISPTPLLEEHVGRKQGATAGQAGKCSLLIPAGRGANGRSLNGNEGVGDISASRTAFREL